MQFYDCRVPSLVVSIGTIMIDSILFTPAFSTGNPNNPIIENSMLKIHDTKPELLTKEQANNIVNFLKSKCQK